LKNASGGNRMKAKALQHSRSLSYFSKRLERAFTARPAGDAALPERIFAVPAEPPKPTAQR